MWYKLHPQKEVVDLCDIAFLYVTRKMYATMKTPRIFWKASDYF